MLGAHGPADYDLVKEIAQLMANTRSDTQEPHYHRGLPITHFLISLKHLATAREFAPLQTRRKHTERW